MTVINEICKQIFMTLGQTGHEICLFKFCIFNCFYSATLLPIDVKLAPWPLGMTNAPNFTTFDPIGLLGAIHFYGRINNNNKRNITTSGNDHGPSRNHKLGRNGML